MDQEEALKLLRGGEQGVAEWNRRRDSGETIPVLRFADLRDADLRDADLRDANLSSASLRSAYLRGANLSGADLCEAVLIRAHLSMADLNHADLSGAELNHADLRGADLSSASLSSADFRGANLSGADLSSADLRGADLREANLNEAKCWDSGFADINLSETKNLESIKHGGPSTVGIDTLFRSRGKLPDVFLRGCGVPETLIVQQRALVGSLEPIQFYSCFISYSTKDVEFAKRLHSRMEQDRLRVWFAPEDLQGGKKIHEQIDEAIRVYDKLLLVLSPESMNSEWVSTEIRKARKAELREKRRKLFPIRLVDFETIRDWECFGADSGKDLGVEIREYFIPDFSNWKDHDSFEAAFARLLNDLKAATGE